MYYEGIHNPLIILPYVMPKAEPIWHIFAIRCQRRDELAAFLTEYGIGTNKHYPIPIHLQPCYRDLNIPKDKLPIAVEISATELSLPMYYGMTDEQIRHVINCVNQFV